MLTPEDLWNSLALEAGEDPIILAIRGDYLDWCRKRHRDAGSTAEW